MAIPKKTTRTKPPAPSPCPPSSLTGKLGDIVTLLQGADGATIAQLTAKTGWQPHSVRGALAGAEINRGALFYLLQNRHYLGEIPHKGTNHPGLHPAIVDRALFDAVQAKLADNRIVRRKRSVKAASHSLTGRVFDGEGRRFSPTFSTGKGGRLHRYYVHSDVQLGRDANLHPDAIRRIGADALETVVFTELRRLIDRPHLGADQLMAMLARVEVRPSDTHLLLNASALPDGHQGDWAVANLEARLKPGERVMLEADGATLRVALTRRMKLRGGKSWTAFAGTAPQKAKVDPALVDALQRANVLATNWSNDDRSDYRRRLRKLAYLSPAIQRQILEGRQPQGLSVVDLLSNDPPLRWSEQADWLSAFDV